MYIAPNSTVQLMTNIPLDPSYTHTLYWASQAQMEAYMSSHVLQQHTNLSYVHKDRGVLKVAGDMGAYALCNYMRFKNTSFENKWFYAFVTDINYVNNEVFEVSFQIDVMQTWFFEYNGNLNQCVVEREHSATDAVGDNIIDEGLEHGDYIQAGSEFVEKYSGNYRFLVIASQSPTGGQNSTMLDNIAGSIYMARCDSAAELEGVLNQYSEGVTSSLEPVMGINQYPLEYVNDAGGPNANLVMSLDLDQSIGFGPFRIWHPTSTDYDTYTPKNNKLYCYPYNFMTFESPDGQSTVLRYENFKNHNQHQFRVFAATFPNVQAVCFPLDYDADGGQSAYMLFSANFPTCPVASDSFAAWWAQNKNSLVTGGVIATVDSAISNARSAGDKLLDALESNARTMVNPLTYLGLNNPGMIGSIRANIDSVIGGVRAVGDTVKTAAEEAATVMAARADHKAVPDTVVTKANGGGVMWAMGAYKFRVLYTKIRPDYARAIDEYFTMFGYAVNRPKTPVYTNRPVWNYIRTKGCTLNRHANIPAAFERDVCACFDRGITFWKNAGQVGQYTADNSPQ